ncbi:hypothetical protein PVK06_043388 [Gossypium arboreum]|uniref:Uncharacterized protein n=1 Tax=Gossypium arboreum TaxID=29729 RepID=A0ABR0MNS6_GOSAR|nr:hypothetical protein PVK06_043388 [Gossypium arboreum]
MTTWISIIKVETRHEFFSLNLEDWFVKNLFDLDYFACTPSSWVSLFGNICWHLRIRRNKYVFNAEIMETDSILGKSCWMRDIFLKENHVSNQTLGRINDDSRKAIRWKPPDDGWKKVKTVGAVCRLSSSAIAGDLI